MIFFREKEACFTNLSFSKDYHCHLLPGVDDGVDDMNVSVQILQRMKDVGITDVVLTPHMNPEIYPSNTEGFIRGRFQKFLSELPSTLSHALQISLAGEYMVVDGFEHRNPEELLQIESGKVLIEMSYYYGSRTMEETIFNLMMAGIQPVIAHPERYLYLADELSVFDRYHDMGATFQLNLLSLSGAYGPASVRILSYIKQKGWYSYRGSDTHTLHHFNTISNMSFPQKLL